MAVTVHTSHVAWGYLLFLFLAMLSLATTIWAVADVTSRPEEAFRRAGTEQVSLAHRADRGIPYPRRSAPLFWT